MRKVYIAADHTGLELKAALVGFIEETLLMEVEDMGAHELVPEDDYPDFIRPCADKVAQEGDAFGIVIGGSGQGEAMAANRVPGVRCALYYGQAHATGSLDAAGKKTQDGYDIVRLAREHNDANVLSLAARFVSEEEAKQAVRTFLETAFTGADRHVRRITKLA